MCTARHAQLEAAVVVAGAGRDGSASETADVADVVLGADAWALAGSCTHRRERWQANPSGQAPPSSHGPDVTSSSCVVAGASGISG